jgi:hypothetical protein
MYHASVEVAMKSKLNVFSFRNLEIELDNPVVVAERQKNL